METKRVRRMASLYCSKCRDIRDRPKQRYCKKCHRQSMRVYRQKVKLPIGGVGNAVGAGPRTQGVMSDT